MEILLLEVIPIVSWAGVVLAFVYWVVRPFVEHIIQKLKNGKGYHFQDLQEQIDILGGNHIKHLESDMSKVEGSLICFKKEMRDQVIEIRDRLTRIETKIK